MPETEQDRRAALLSKITKYAIEIINSDDVDPKTRIDRWDELNGDYQSEADKEIVSLCDEIGFSWSEEEDLIFDLKDAASEKLIKKYKVVFSEWNHNLDTPSDLGESASNIVDYDFKNSDSTVLYRYRVIRNKQKYICVSELPIPEDDFKLLVKYSNF